MGEIRYQLIIQFLQDELSTQERKELQEWRNASSENEQQFQEVKFLWTQTPNVQSIIPEPTIDLDAALQKVHQQLPQEPSAKVIPLRRRFMQMTAAASIIFMAGFFWWLQTNTVSMVTVSTLANEQKEVVLPDNSIVWLNENSQLTYPEYFDKSNRTINMNGDLVFEVTHNKQSPFIVKSSDLMVQVLGTKFNVVSQNDENKNSFVHVLNGKVAVQKEDHSGKKLTLQKGMSAVLNPSGSLSLTDDFSPNRLAWLHKSIEFNQNTLADVFADLEYLFKLKIEVENPKILNCAFTGKFDKDTSIDDILDMMKIIFNITTEKPNLNHIKIKKGTCAK